MEILVGGAKLRGKGKIASPLSLTSPHWKTSNLSLGIQSGKWVLGISDISSKIDTFILDSANVKSFKKSPFYLTVKDGTAIRFNEPSNPGLLQKVVDKIEDILSGRAIVPGDKTPSTPSSMNKGHVDPTSPHGFTNSFHGSVKEKSERRSTPEGKENYGRSPENTGKKFLEVGVAKSSETLNFSSTPKNFYSSNTPRAYGSFATNSGSSQKRRPGMMDLHPEKRPKLSNLNNDARYSWSQKSSPYTQISTPTTPLQGFSNLGNTCYMNAILQSLLGLHVFTEDLLSVARKLHLDKSIPTDSTLFIAVARLILARKNNSNNAEKRRSTLQDIKKAISSSAKRFSGYQQHDAHEFLNQLLDQCKEEIIKINKDFVAKLAPEPVTPKKENDKKREFLNPTYLNFEFEVVHTITCTQCREEVNKTEVFYDLSVDMPRRKDKLSRRTLQDALDQFFHRETIEYHCEKCDHKEAKVTHRFFRLPRVLILHLKRYSFDQMTSFHSKVGQSIELHKYLTLGHHCTQDTSPPYPEHYRQEYENESSSPDTQSVICDSFSPVKQPQSAHKFGFNSATKSRNLFKVNVEHSPVRSSLNFSDKKKDMFTFNKRLSLKGDKETGVSDYISRRQDDQMQRAVELSMKTMRDDECRRQVDDDDEEYEEVIKCSKEQTTANEHIIPSMSDEEMLKIALERSMEGSALQEHTDHLFDDEHAPQAGDHVGYATNTGKVRSHYFVDGHTDSPSPAKKPRLSMSLNKTPLKTPEKNGEKPVHRSGSSGLNKHKFKQMSAGIDGLINGSFENDEKGENNEFAYISLDGQFDSESPKRTTDKQLSGFTKSDTDENESIFAVDNKANVFGHTYSNTALKSSTKNYQGAGFRRKRNLSDQDHKQSFFSGCLSCGKTRILCSCIKSKTRTISDPNLPPFDNADDFCDNKQTAPNETGKFVKKHTKGGVFKKVKNWLKFGKEKKKEGKENEKSALVETACEAGEDYSGFDDVKLLEEEDLKQEENVGSKYGELSSDEDAVNAAEEDLDKIPEENKENRTPPKTPPKLETSVTEEGTTIVINSKEEEDRNLEMALKESLKDENVEMSYEEQIRKAMELSLQDFNKQVGFSLPPEQPEVFASPTMVKSDEESRRLDKNSMTGELPYSYQLMSVVSHLGQSSSLGHYISDVYDLNKQVWHSYDDSEVLTLPEDKVLQQRERSGYIFFYMCKELVQDIEKKNCDTKPSKANKALERDRRPSR